MTYDAHLFYEIIESIQGINFLRDEIDEDVTLRFYTGVHGNLVVIDASFEDIEATEGKMYLKQLGVEYLIASLFPEAKVPVVAETKAIS
jgi:hypothetical protein